VFIVNQDREPDRIVCFHGALCTFPAMLKGRPIGINLYSGASLLDGHLLGTFDTVDEAMQEIENIFNCKKRFYCVRGYYPPTKKGVEASEMAD